MSENETIGARPDGTGSRPSDQTPSGSDASRFDPSRDVIAQRLYDISNRIFESKFWPGWMPRPLHEDPAALEVHNAYADEVLAMLRESAPPGCRIVPEEPTEEMADALERAYWDRHEYVTCYARDQQEEGGGPAGYAYRAALAAASASGTEAASADAMQGSAAEGESPIGEAETPYSLHHPAP